MFARIILGFDDTAQGRDALALVKLLASQAGRSVVVSHVIPAPMPYDSRTREYVKMVQEHVHRVLDPALSALSSLSGLTVEGRPIESASVPRGLHEIAEEEGASLLVIGSTHRGPVGRVVLGSVGEILLAGTPAAVAVAPRGYAERETGSLEVVGVGFNASPESRSALRTAAALAAESGAKLRAVAVHEGPLQERHAFKGARAGAHSLDAQLERSLEEEGIADAERVILSGGAAGCLADACGDTDLLVIGSRSYGPMHHALLGSVSAKLMRSCPAPLIVVPRGAAATQAGRTRAEGARMPS